MKFLLDVCVSSRSLTTFLVGQGHDVVSAISIDPRMSDAQFLEVALREDRVLITEDKDFGELLFVQHRPHGPVVRVVQLAVDEQVQAVGEMLEHYSHELAGPVIVTISRGRIRIRRRESYPALRSSPIHTIPCYKQSKFAQRAQIFFTGDRSGNRGGLKPLIKSNSIPY